MNLNVLSFVFIQRYFISMMYRKFNINFLNNWSFRRSNKDVNNGEVFGLIFSYYQFRVLFAKNTSFKKGLIFFKMGEKGNYLEKIFGKSREFENFFKKQFQKNVFRLFHNWCTIHIIIRTNHEKFEEIQRKNHWLFEH